MEIMDNKSYTYAGIVPECNKINPDEVGMLDRNGFIAVLNDIRKLTGVIDKYFNQILSANSEIEEAKNHAEELRNAVSGWVYGVTVILIIVCSIMTFPVASVFGIVLSVVAGLLLQKNFFKDIDKLKNGKRREEEANNYLVITLPPLQNQIKTAQKNIEVIQQSDEGIWAVDIIGEELFNSESVDDLIEIVKSRRADNLKEALNKYDSTKHTNKMEEMQRAIQNASEVAAEESVKQTAYAKETAKSSHQAATAAKATAYHTRKTAYNTKQIDKNTRRFR